jgi:hypothetical protein
MGPLVIPSRFSRLVRNTGVVLLVVMVHHHWLLYVAERMSAAVGPGAFLNRRRLIVSFLATLRPVVQRTRAQDRQPLLAGKGRRRLKNTRHRSSIFSIDFTLLIVGLDYRFLPAN